MPSSRPSIVVLGDCSLDRYSFGIVNRISPEAPVPLVEVKKESYVPGNSSNSALQLAALGARVVEVTPVGDDPEGDMVLRSLRERGVEAPSPVRWGNTTVVHRIMAGRHQLLMMQKGPPGRVRGRAREELLKRLMEALKGAQGLLVSDHTGILGDTVPEAISMAKGLGARVVVNAYSHNAFDAPGADMVRISRDEASRATGISVINETSIRNIGMEIVTRGGAGSALIAWVDEGAHLFSRSSYTFIRPAGLEPLEFTGMGDVMASIALYAMLSGLDVESSAKLAYLGAARYASRGGRRYITAEELKGMMEVEGVNG